MATVGPHNPKPSSRSFASVSISTAGTGDVVNLTGLTLSSIQMSTAWTDADITFEGNVDGSTNYYPVYNSTGTALTYETSANRLMLFDPAIFSGLQWLRVMSVSTASTAIEQAAARTLKLGLSEFVEAN